jgi:hypothetical protein
VVQFGLRDEPEQRKIPFGKLRAGSRPLVKTRGFGTMP